MAQHFIQMGTMEVDGEILQMIPVQRPEILQDEPHPDVAPSPVVEVSWSRADLSREMLRMYLQNPKHSGGGEVKDMRFFADERKAYVRFVDAECKSRIFCRKNFQL